MTDPTNTNRKPMECQHCKGSGLDDASGFGDLVTCEECRGSGVEFHKDSPHPVIAAASAGHGEQKELGYAQRLATSLWKKHWDEATNWQPLDHLMGVLTQIDNMTCTLVNPTKASSAAPAASGEDSRYVCPQCGPDPRGADVHAQEAHTWPTPLSSRPAATAQEVTDERKAFEAWATSLEIQLPIERHALSPRTYTAEVTAWACSAWMARALLAASTAAGTAQPSVTGEAGQEVWRVKQINSGLDWTYFDTRPDWHIENGFVTQALYTRPQPSADEGEPR